MYISHNFTTLETNLIVYAPIEIVKKLHIKIKLKSSVNDVKSKNGE